MRWHQTKACLELQDAFHINNLVQYKKQQSQLWEINGIFKLRLKMLQGASQKQRSGLEGT